MTTTHALAPTGYRPPAATVPQRRGTVGRLAAVLLVCGVLGYALAHIPSPHDPDDIWLGNLAAPYLVVPALAGAWRWRRAGTAALAGALAGAGLVLGFYDGVGVGLSALRPGAWSGPGLPDASTAEVVLDGYRRWLSTFALGHPWGTPWLTIAVLVGLLMGPAGHLLARARGAVTAALAALVVAAPLLGEPLFYAAASVGGERSLPVIGRVGLPLSPRNTTVLVAEALLGAGLLVVLALLAAPRSSPVRAFRSRTHA
ncbi:MAG: hypothetical protein HY830_24880 [Actinobacteria bacterium]|nr:hypothetical protein [Actinomycetota bacterium]